jgi:hypothetical protein
MMLSLLNPRVWIALVIAALISGTGWWVYGQGAASVHAQWTAAELVRTEQSAKIAADTAATTQNLQTSVNVITKVKDAQIAKLHNDLAVALDGLRNRPERPATGIVSQDTAATSGPGCTGAQLYRNDAAAFAREFARAERLLADLVQCQDQYNTAYEALNKEVYK